MTPAAAYAHLLVRNSNKFGLIEQHTRVTRFLQLSLLRPNLVGRGKSIGSSGLSIPTTAFPPFEVVATLAIDFVPPLTRNMITADAALAVEQRLDESPFRAIHGGDLDLLEESDLGNLG